MTIIADHLQRCAIPEARDEPAATLGLDPGPRSGHPHRRRRHPAPRSRQLPPRAPGRLHGRRAPARRRRDWGIVGVASRSRTVVDAMHAQDSSTRSPTISPAGTSLSDPRRAHRRLRRRRGAGARRRAHRRRRHPHRHAHRDRERLQLLRRRPSTSTSTTPPCAPTSRGGAPRSTIGQLARGLQARAAAGGAPISILSCDNLAANGEHTEKLVREFLHALPRRRGRRRARLPRPAPSPSRPAWSTASCRRPPRSCASASARSSASATTHPGARRAVHDVGHRRPLRRRTPRLGGRRRRLHRRGRAATSR